MSDALLVFADPPVSQPAELVFGEVTEPGDSYVQVAVAFGPPGFSAIVGKRYDATLAIEYGKPTIAVLANYSSDTARPLVGKTGIPWTGAQAAQAEVGAGHGRAATARSGVETPWRAAASAHGGVESPFRETSRAARDGLESRHRSAIPVAAGAGGLWREMLRHIRPPLGAPYRQALPVQAVALGYWQDRLRVPRPAYVAPYREAVPLRRSQSEDIRRGRLTRQSSTARHREAIRPPAGIYVPPVPPGPDPCYLPDPQLLFVEAWGNSPALLFRCDLHPDPGGPPATVIVPIRGAYIVNNTIDLRRLPDNLVLPVIEFSMRIDADSWTWSWSATLMYQAVDALQPSGGDPIALLATINGQAYRLIAERLETSRTFEQRTVRVSGRGRNAVLADPYAPRMSFGQSEARTAQQLMEEALTDNGVPIGWSVDHGLTDWLVPGNTWSHQGTWLTAVRRIAEAAGGYVQPHPTDEVLRVLPRYPVAPWDWAGVTPDFELPSAVVSTEAIEWVDKPIYNRVFVMGERNGILGRVTRTGTAGDTVAATVVDPLITANAAAGQRGVSILSDVGRQAAISLSLPVLNETGVIPPGAFVRYLDGSTTRLGLVRTTAVAGGLQLRQTLGIETHVAA